MKQLILKCKKAEVQLNNTAISICFLISLNQNEIAYANKTLFALRRKNLTLYNNLKAIVLLKEDRVDEAFYMIEELLNFKSRFQDGFDGRVFPFTVIFN